MIKNLCSNCGSALAASKVAFASKSFPAKCKECGKKQFRKHDISKALVYLGGSTGLLGLLFLYMAQGGQAAGIALTVFFSLLLFTYIVELFLFDLSEYTYQEERRAVSRYKKHIYIAVAVIFLGAIFYVFDV